MLQGFYEFSQSHGYIVSNFDGFRLYHDPDERFRAGGTDQNTTLPVQGFLLASHLPQVRDRYPRKKLKSALLWKN